MQTCIDSLIVVDIIPNTALEMDGVALSSALADEFFAAVFFDPQYGGVAKALDYGNFGARQGKRADLINTDTDDINEIVAQSERILKPSGYLFYWQDKRDAMDKSLPIFHGDLVPVDTIIWDKGRMGMGYRSRNRFEVLRIYQKQPKTTKNWGDKGIPDVWQEKIDKPRSGHPHRKPPLLTQRLIECVSDEGDFVGDFCAGSFTTMDACLAANRTFIGCDLSLQYRDAEIDVFTARMNAVYG